MKQFVPLVPGKQMAVNTSANIVAITFYYSSHFTLGCFFANESVVLCVKTRKCPIQFMSARRLLIMEEKQQMLNLLLTFDKLEPQNAIFA